MTAPFPLSLGPEQNWVVPVIGAAVCVVTFLIAWIVSARTARPPAGRTEDLDAVLLKGVTQERRALTRRRGNIVEVQLAGAEGASLRGWVLDRSQGGLCLLVDQ